MARAHWAKVSLGRCRESSATTSFRHYELNVVVVVVAWHVVDDPMYSDLDASLDYSNDRVVAEVTRGLVRTLGPQVAFPE